MSRPAAFPVSFGENFALFHQASGDTGYVVCGAWGYDELCSRAFLRTLSDQLAGAGFPVLRIDYPGTVDMLDPDPETGLESWIESAVAAADRLLEISACKRVLYLGLGIGAAIAFLAAGRRDDVEGLVLAAPVTSGRRYLRELQIHAQVTNDGFGLGMQGSYGDTGFSGFLMPGMLQTELKSINLGKVELPGKLPCLVLTREGIEADTDFANHLSSSGHPTSTQSFEGYAELMESLNTSFIPMQAIDDIVTWSRKHFAPRSGPDIPAEWADAAPVMVQGDAFTEKPVTFGPDGQFFGVLCRPAEDTRQGPVAVFLNSGYTHHAGWGRIWVWAARELARKGVASLRFDMANVGDTPPTDGLPRQVLYTVDQFNDLEAALDFLEQAVPGPIFLVGRCSGSYVSFNVAASDDRVSGAMLINQLKLIWDPEVDTEDTLRYGARPLDEYRRRAFSLNTIKRVLTGQVDLLMAGRHIFNHISDRVLRKLAPYLGRLTKLGRQRHDCFGKFTAMRERDIPVHIVSCESDGSLDELARYFGKDYSGLKAYPNVIRSLIANADHNLTPFESRRVLLDLLEKDLLDPRWSSSNA